VISKKIEVCFGDSCQQESNLKISYIRLFIAKKTAASKPTAVPIHR
jgi:hypothetical protein